MPNRLDAFEGDPVGFITEGLGQCLDHSWRGWLAVLKAAFCVPLTVWECAFFKDVSGGRDPPRRRVKELWLIVGRRGGKDSLASLIAVNAARFANVKGLRPGETALVACLATDNVQAGIVFNYVRGYFQTVPDLMPWVSGKLPESTRAPISLVNRTEIRITTNNFRAPRGYPFACVIFDEVGTWSGENSASPDIETYRAILPGLGSIPGSMLIGISSPYRKQGILYDKWKAHFGKDDDDILVVQGETRKFNPNWSQAEIDKALRDDPEAAGAEWLAKFREDLADYVDRDLVESLVMKGTTVLPPVAGLQYYAFADPSGGQRDSFGLAIAHRSPKNGHGVLDCLYEVRAPFKPLNVVPQIAQVVKNYGLKTVRGDHYAGNWPTDVFSECKIGYEISDLSKSEIYLEFLPHLNSGVVDLLDNPTLVNQLCSLERRTARGGRDTVDHPPSGLDDLVNSAAGALQMVLGEDQPIRVSAEAVARARATPPRRAYRFN